MGVKTISGKVTMSIGGAPGTTTTRPKDNIRYSKAKAGIDRNTLEHEDGISTAAIRQITTRRCRAQAEVAL